MLIDNFSDRWIEELNQFASNRDASEQLFLLVDGAFSPGLHRMIESDEKALLFALRPGCNNAVRDASPFLVPYSPNEKKLRTLLKRCNRWPMLSAIVTTESLHSFAMRLAAWCVVEADGQRFNFRFPDTRRLPAILQTLTPPQRGALSGPMKRWTYIDRSGRWKTLPHLECAEHTPIDPVLDAHQFACLLDDSRADELMVLLRNRGHDVFKTPSRSHALLTVAVKAAFAAKLDDDEMPRWCAWYWKKDQLYDDTAAAFQMQSWRNTVP
jgi:hypothetical protein